MIRAYIGNLGTGKTMRMVGDCIKDMKRGRHVISNTPIEFDWKGRHYRAEYARGAKEFELAIKTRRNVVIAIDEAGILFSSLFWHKLDLQYIMKFRQSRKAGCDFYFTAQGYMDVVAPLRKLCNEVVSCKKRRFMGFFSKLPYLKGDKWKDLKIVWIPATIFYGYYFSPEFAQKGLYNRKGRPNYFKSKTMYPSEYRFIWKSYDTLKEVDAGVMVKGSRAKQMQADDQVQSKPQPNMELIAEAERALRESRSALAN